MALPTMTEEQRKAALEKARVAREKRAALKADIKAGKKTLAEVLDSMDDVTRKTKVVQVLKALPGVGKVTAEKAMAEAGIPENRNVGGLGSNQKAALLEILG